jgi:RNA polymerase sporulation-specific sigma factor
MEDKELKELIFNNQDLIYSIIHRFRSKDYEDLFQTGCVGLINAYKRFNNSQNVKFTTYAYNFIVGEIYKYLINNRTIRMSPKNNRLTNSINKAYEYLTNHLGRSPTENEMCSFLEIEPYKYSEIKNIMMVESIDFDNGYEIVNYDKVSKDDLIDLKDALSNLTDEEKLLINARFYNNYTQQELAKIYNTNQVKISREEKKILTKLRDKMLL